ncbi:hypothetical protein [Cohnella sp. WQ 127256]|uniref:hypothetical protein n=1 Tax=Cohnella sp. WQ 127256 TaxID=2938790 RepID=UPI0021191E1B|nr:hypothetical protein [Cohnella sp. WQ 127256]
MNYRMTLIGSILVFSIVLSGCGAKITDSENPSASSSPSATIAPEPTETSSATPGVESNELILKQFQAQALASPSADELMASFKQHIEAVQPAQADELVRTLESYYEKNLPEMGKKFESSNIQEKLAALDWPITSAQISEIKEETIRELAEQTLAGGYKLVTAEGFIFPIVDYDKMLSYSDKVTTEMGAYLNLMATESDQATASDGGLVITWDELASRTLAAESYVVTFPDSPERIKVENQFMNYLSMYLIGLDNTPIFDYETFTLLPDVKKQYEQMVESHTKTITGQLTEQFLGLLKDSKDAVFIKDVKGTQTDIPAMKQFREQLKSSAHSKLPSSKK